MPANIINGKALADKIRDKLKEKISKGNAKPGLAIIQVGDNPVSAVYINKKMLAGNDVGINMQHVKLPENCRNEDVLQKIDELNNSPEIHGMIVQLPLPKQLDTNLVMNAVLPHKDVDGFHPVNIGNLAAGSPKFIPATAKGILKLIESTGIPLKGRHAVVVGRSNIVGRPTSYLLLQKDCTVTGCHRETRDLASHTRQADILVVAVGKIGLITGSMIKPGAIVIDVGMNKTEDGRLCGDVDFNTAKDFAGWITTVPGGVGPMTVAMLLENTYEAMVNNPFK